ncbi:exosome non-catalytic core subunit rrp40 [Dispira parvispora]|uniref:Ribosomal RNA-processing protein 40 n=1 Tax=Dispira parvispora TaxID=1520584 RepID=A0A9W8AUM5_9FUNG|nr:exosome non-catalytic core subunit rrp40 [Dispira parvispora]
MSTVPTLVIPGDTLPIADGEVTLRLGPGLTQTGNTVQAVQAGRVQHNPHGNRWWVNSSKKRYVPSTGEPVIGTVVGRSADYYRVDIGSAHSALLPVLAFEGATKRNRPNLNVGAVVYGRLTLAHTYMEPEIECYNSTTGKADGYGELQGGFVIQVSLHLCQRLMNPSTKVLDVLGSHIPLDVAVGLNGRIWIHTDSTKNTIAAANAIRHSEFLDASECHAMVKRIISTTHTSEPMETD